MIQRVIRMGATREDAEDIVQSALVSVSKQLPRIHAEGVGGFTHRALQTAFIDSRRRLKRRAEVVPLGEHIAMPERDGEEPQSHAVRAALRRIPRHYAEVFVLRNLWGLSYGEISLICSLSLPAVRGTLNRAKSAIIRELGSELSPLANAV